MISELTIEDMTAAAEQLSRSQKGRAAMKSLLKFMDGDGLSLDQHNQIAVLQLLEGYWGPFTGSARDAMRDALRAK